MAVQGGQALAPGAAQDVTGRDRLARGGLSLWALAGLVLVGGGVFSGLSVVAAFGTLVLLLLGSVLGCLGLERVLRAEWRFSRQARGGAPM